MSRRVSLRMDGWRYPPGGGDIILKHEPGDSALILRVRCRPIARRRLRLIFFKNLGWDR